ncbi:hypothetical protein BDF14DRAFT_1781971 [Spinellus fusiger]|nr:hypothetical protein BDF14DRAFT_1781971 [Spinellus fusiger]
MNGTATPTENTNGNITSNTTHEHHANNTHNYHNSTNTPPLTTKRYKEKQKETQHHQYFKIEEPQPTPNITHQRQPIPSTSARQHSKEEEDGNEEEEYDDEYDDEEEDDDEQNIFLSSHSNNPFHFASHVDTEEAMEHLIQCIENIAPKHEWRHIRSLNLSHQNLTSVVDLADLFPCLEELDISNNAITEISRLPDTLQVFKVKKNRLTDIQGFSSLPNIQYIDLCDNAIDTFEGFGPCLHLRILHAENNKLYSCKPFRMINSLTTLNLRSNVIKHLRFGDTEMYELESLDLSYNRLESLDSIEGLHNLRILNLDHNEIESVTLQMPMAHLKILRLNFNRLSTFDSTMFPDLRTLYLDTNQIGRIVGFSCIPRLINFSLRDQGGQKVDFNIRHLRGVRKAYLSGNMFKNIYLMHDFFTLEYLELCAASINELPDNFASLMPNLVVLYLSNNFLDSIRPLRKLRYLRKLVLIGNKITNLSDTIHDISSISHLSFLDLRENPISRRLYPPLKLTVTKPKTQKKLTRYLAPEHDATWPERDAIFYNNLAEHWKLRRDTYRASFIKLRPTLEVLDHCSVTREEKETAEFNVSQIRDKSGGPLRERTAAEQESRENDTLS